ncbi:hypothetical protein GCM10022270_16100 [Terriglobus aquaticus]
MAVGTRSLKLRPGLIAAVTILLFSGAAVNAQWPTADYVPAAALYSYNGTNYSALTTTGTAGQAADNQPGIGILATTLPRRSGVPAGHRIRAWARAAVAAERRAAMRAATSRERTRILL